MLFCFGLIYTANAQTTLSRNDGNNFRTSVHVTNNGISLLPTFSLGKPAAQFDLILSPGRLSFEPQIRYSLDGKPWSYIFWLRYKVIKRDRFFLNVGTHPALIFRQLTTTINGVSRDYMASQRYLAAEISPNFRLSRKVTLGAYYLHSSGLDRGTLNGIDFVTMNATINNILLFAGVRLRLAPQFYHLQMDEEGGYYFSNTATLYGPGYPLSVSSIINQVIDTDITNSKPLVWNISLIWTFSANYVKQTD